MNSSPLPQHAYDALIEAVQLNCRIADAYNAQENPMCVYLMKMRDYFRWSHQLPVNACIPKEQLGKWINQQERLWETLAEEDFVDVPIGTESYSPFETDLINQQLQDNGLCYSAGIGRAGQAHFHIGQLEQHPLVNNQRVVLSGEEYARDLTASPAHAIGGKIYVRRDALQRYIWSKVEEWRWKQPDNAMGRAMQHYAFEKNADDALATMTQHEILSVYYHELGETQAGDLLGPQWEEMLITLQGQRNEIFCRAARDHLADCLVTLPDLIAQQNWPSVHFYFANFEGFRKLIWPELKQHYDTAVEQQSLEPLHCYVCGPASDHWATVCQAIVKAYESGSEKVLSKVIAENISVG